MNTDQTPAATTDLSSSATVLYLGPEGTFTHQAAIALTHPGELPVPVATADEALASLAEPLATESLTGPAAAILPWDNTVNGPVVASIDALCAHPQLTITDSTHVNISFNAYTLTDVSPPMPLSVASHPHALAQCRTYISNLSVPAESTHSTAAACRDLTATQIAIGAPLCGELYGLHVVATGVEDRPGAVTTFVRIERTTAGEAAGLRPAALHIRPRINRPGTLASILSTLAAARVNVGAVTARPDPDSHGTYAFVIAVEAPADPDAETAFKQACELLAYQGPEVRILGRL